MARPQKVGLDYFPLDTSLDVKFELIEAEFGLTGFAVIVKLLQMIYAEQGYYSEWTSEVALLFAKRNGLGGNVVSEIVVAAIKRGIFNAELFDRYSILTSKGIQDRYFEAVSRRSNLNVKKQYLLINCNNLPINVINNGVNANINSENADNNAQSKRKEIKSNKSKVNYSKVTECFEQNIGTLSPAIFDDVVFYLNKGIDEQLMVACIKKAVGANKPSWNYIKGILKNLERKGIKTVGDWEKELNNSGKCVSSDGSENNRRPKREGIIYL